MSRFNPTNLLEAIAQQIATSKGWETANMIRKEMPHAEAILQLVKADLKQFLVHDEEGVIDHLDAAIAGVTSPNSIAGPKR